jgi:hypothetical protein
LIAFMDESRVRNLFKRWLEPGEEALSIGKAFNKNWYTCYYTCQTSRRMLFMRWNPYDEKFVVKDKPLDQYSSFMQRKKIIAIPFDQPYLIGKKEQAIYEKLLKIARSGIPQGEGLISMARVNRGSLSHLLIISDNNLVVVRIERRSLRVLSTQVHVLADLKELLLLNGKKRVVMEVPFEKCPGLRVKLTTADGKTESYVVKDILGRGGMPVVTGL